MPAFADGTIAEGDVGELGVAWKRARYRWRMHVNKTFILRQVKSIDSALGLTDVPAPLSPVAPAIPLKSWEQQLDAPFAMRLAQDARGRIWVGTEERGVWRFDPIAPDPAKSWTHFTVADGIGDDNGYAIACDHQGRVWVGTLNHGVSVCNGQAWKNYDQMTGPLGGHVTVIAISPKNGDVWMATEVGLARYRASAE